MTLFRHLCRTSLGVFGPRRSFVLPMLALLVSALAPWARAAEVAVTKEYQIKAAFLYNFTKFVDWPPSAFANATSPIVIGVLAPKSFGDELREVVKDRKVNGRSIEVRTIVAASELHGVHLLFVRAEEESRLASLLKDRLSGCVLTVGESPRFAAEGGMINFVLDNGKVRFEINQDAGRQGGLTISAQLLEIASAVRRKI